MPFNNATFGFNFSGTDATRTTLISGWLVANVTSSQSKPGLLMLDTIQSTLTSRMGFNSSEATTSGYRSQSTDTRVPEPSAALLGGLGLLAIFRRRTR